MSTRQTGQKAPPPLSADLLHGADAIGQELGISRRCAFNKLQAGQIPAKKWGKSWVASRTGLRRYLASMLTPNVA
jgi:hypothetical protein